MNEHMTPIDGTDWDDAYRLWHRQTHELEAGSDDARSHWDARAGRFLRKEGRSDYINQLIALLDLAEGETVLDMGCGAGSLAIPLAQRGHRVIAVDFSDGMLEGLAQRAEEEGVASKIEVHRRSWQEDWSGIPMADVAVSSRSFITDELADGISKLEGNARERCVLTVGAGDRPFRDARIFTAMGRERDAAMPPQELAMIANHLWAHERLPRIEYIEYPGYWARDSREKLIETIRDNHKPENDEQKRKLDEYLEEHIVFNEEEGKWALDYARTDRWGAIMWDVSASRGR